MTSDLAQRYIRTVKTAILNDLYPEAEAERAYLIKVADGDEPFDRKRFYSGATADPDMLAAIDQAHAGGRHLAGRLKYVTIGASMIGRARMDNLQHCLETVLADDVPEIDPRMDRQPTRPIRVDHLPAGLKGGLGAFKIA